MAAACACWGVQVLESAALFAPWLTFRLHLRVIINSAEAACAAHVTAGGGAAGGPGGGPETVVPIGELLVHNPLVRVVGVCRDGEVVGRPTLIGVGFLPVVLNVCHLVQSTHVPMSVPRVYAVPGSDSVLCGHPSP